MFITVIYKIKIYSMIFKNIQYMNIFKNNQINNQVIIEIYIYK